MRKPRRFNLLIVHGKGTRVLRLNLPRWILYGGLSLLVLAVSTLGAIYGDYFFLKQQSGRVAALEQRVAEQQAFLERQAAERQELVGTFHRRISQVRSEVSGWGELHAKIWEPFGPEAGLGKRGNGVGGGALERVSATSAPVSLTDELDLLWATVQEEGQSLRALARYLARAGRVLVALPSRWPVRGAVNSEFGRRRSPWRQAREFHSGIDITAKRGTPVKAPAPGTVVFVGRHGDHGRTVILEHGHDVRTLYGHLKVVRVKRGQRVARGRVIALSGNTGRSTGPHLHYEVHVRGKAVNPRGFLWD